MGATQAPTRLPSAACRPVAAPAGACSQLSPGVSGVHLFDIAGLHVNGRASSSFMAPSRWVMASHGSRLCAAQQGWNDGWRLQRRRQDDARAMALQPGMHVAWGTGGQCPMEPAVGGDNCEGVSMGRTECLLCFCCRAAG